MRALTALLLASGAVAVIPGLRHHHQHVHRALDDRAVVYVPGPTVVVYQLDGHPISEAEVKEGIKNGTLLIGNDGQPTTVPINQPERTPVPQSSPPALEFHEGEKPSAAAPQQPPPSAPSSAAGAAGAATPPPASPNPQAQPSKSDSNQNAPSSDELNREFPSGSLPCDSFPSGYGAVPIDHQGLGGWTGLQAPEVETAAGYDRISTADHGSCPNGQCCKTGSFCSYSCPPGYLKASWPKKQGATKQSVGGLFCNKDGKLEMGDGSAAKTLCMKGADHVRVVVQNKLSQNVSICRTDYPGTESETIPLTLAPGQSGELAVPDSRKYYFWDNKPTSAQYYINNRGVSEQDACWWGSDSGKAVGNSAPLNLGTGFNGDLAYTSLAPNSQWTKDPLNFNIQFSGDKVSNPCKYANGKFYHGDGHEDPAGCTAAHPGDINVIFS